MESNAIRSGQQPEHGISLCPSVMRPERNTLRLVVIRRLGDFIGGIPVPAWLQAVRSTLGLLGLGVIFLFVLSLVVYLNPGGFSTSQRLLILLAIGVLWLVLYLIGALFTGWAGDPLYSPAERLLGRGRDYGTELNPQRRRRVLSAPKEEAPIGNLLEAEAHAVEAGELPPPHNDVPGEKSK